MLPQMTTQYVYCLSNPSFETLLKIGWTRDYPTRRLKELSRTSVPTPFKLEFYIETPNGNELETKIHTLLKSYRKYKDKEFFEITLETLISNLETHLNLKLTYDVNYGTISKKDDDVEMLSSLFDMVYSKLSIFIEYMEKNNNLDIVMETTTDECCIIYDIRWMQQHMELRKQTLSNLKESYLEIKKEIGGSLMRSDNLSFKKELMDIDKKIDKYIIKFKC